MVRSIAFGSVALACGLLLTGAPAQAKKKAPKAAATVSVQVKNGCAAETKVKVGGQEITVAAGATSEPQTLPGADDWSYPLHLVAPQASDLGLVSLLPAGQYAIELKDCAAAGANIETRDLAERPATASPNAAAEVRFRARQNTHLEYKGGSATSFKPLSIAMTKYVEAPAGKYEFTFRLRAAKGGPVMKTVTRTLEIEAGHRYLIEANVAGTEVFFKKEDEGLPKKG